MLKKSLALFLPNKKYILVNESQFFISYSFKGKEKRENQDNFLIIEENRYNLYVVFDGVGSAANSKKATEYAKDFIEKNYLNYTTDSFEVEKMMLDCNLFILSKKKPESLTTYCIVIVYNNKEGEIIYSSMGDSRIYLITNQYIEQITMDDRVPYTKNVINKCLGMSSLSKRDFKQHYVQRQSQSILICTDGFYSFLEDNKMFFFEIFRGKFTKSIGAKLNSAIAHKNLDDCTYIFIK